MSHPDSTCTYDEAEERELMQNKYQRFVLDIDMTKGVMPQDGQKGELLRLLEEVELQLNDYTSSETYADGVGGRRVVVLHDHEGNPVGKWTLTLATFDD